MAKILLAYPLDADSEARLDAVFFSPHKFLGGPGSPGVLVFNEKLVNLVGDGVCRFHG